MKASFYVFSERFLLFVALVSTAVLLLSGFYLVTTQYRVRMLVVEKERAEKVRHELMDAASQLALDRASAALPKNVMERAKAMGYVAASVSNANIVLIEVEKGAIEGNYLEVKK